MQKVGRDVATSGQREWKSTSDKRRDVSAISVESWQGRRDIGSTRMEVNKRQTSRRQRDFFCLTIIKRKRGPKFEGIEESTESKAARIRSVEKTVGFLFSSVLKEC